MSVTANPVIVITPTEGAFGTVITITGTLFNIEDEIGITYGGIPIITTPSVIISDSVGSFSATITPPNYVYDFNTISATDGIHTATTEFDHIRKPEYCSAKNIADWLRITISPNTDPNTSMVEEFIIDNEDQMDYEMGHTFLQERQVKEIMSVTRLWDWGRGMPIFPRHRGLKPFDPLKGDRLEVWNGSGWVDQSRQRIYFEEVKGTVYIKGYLFTILTKDRFRLTYRYGGNQEMQKIPKDIKRCAVLMTALNILETDFKMSQISYGGEGNVDKQKIMDRWQDKIDKILRQRSEIITIYG